MVIVLQVNFQWDDDDDDDEVRFVLDQHAELDFYSASSLKQQSADRYVAPFVIVLSSSTVDRGFEPKSGQTKDYYLVFVASPLSTQHAALRRKGKDWLSRNQNNE
jgi:hypothetical protein